MEQPYPFIISIFKDSDRFLINPNLVTTGEFRSNSPLIKTFDKNEENIELLLGNTILESIEYIKNSPILNIMETPNSIGDYIYWKQENKYRSWNAFNKKNVCCSLSFYEDKTYVVSSAEPDISNIKRETGLLKNGSPSEIGKAIINVMNILEKSVEKKKPDPYPPVEVELLSDQKVEIHPPRDRHFTDMQDGSAAEIYRLYEYSPKEGAEPSAYFYLSIAADLDCDMSEDNIRKTWEKQNGKAEYFEVKPTEHGIFKLRAEMRNKCVHRISYLLQIDESELLDCTMELLKPNTRKKLDEKLSVMFEEFARQCKIKS